MTAPNRTLSVIDYNAFYKFFLVMQMEQGKPIPKRLDAFALTAGEDRFDRRKT
jgi:hypothetical protein